MDCLKRSFDAGFRWARKRVVVPSITTFDEAKELASKYGLTVFQDVYTTDNRVVLVIYRDNYTQTDSEYHAVFMSDIAPMCNHDVYAVIIGWEDL